MNARWAATAKSAIGFDCKRGKTEDRKCKMSIDWIAAILATRDGKTIMTKKITSHACVSCFNLANWY